MDTEANNCSNKKMQRKITDKAINYPGPEDGGRVVKQQKAVYPPPVRTCAHMFSFFVCTKKNWNDLPNAVVPHFDPSSFRSSIKSTMCPELHSLM